MHFLVSRYQVAQNFREYTEQEFYACFEQKFAEKFGNSRKCSLPWDLQEKFPKCETILETVGN